MNRVVKVISVSIFAILLFQEGIVDGKVESQISTLEVHIDSLRIEARYAEAFEVAKELLELKKSDKKAKPYEIVDVERLVKTLKYIAGLTEEKKREFAEADRLTAEYVNLYEKGNYSEAAALVEKQLEVRKRILGKENLDVVESLSWLAELLDAKGDYAGAEPLYMETLAMYRKLLGEEHPKIASSLNAMAIFLKAKGDYGAAEPLYREALAMRRKLLGEEHPRVASSLNNLACLLYAKGDYVAAEPLHREALAMRRKLLGEEHPNVAVSLNNLACLLESKGDYATAEPL
jgi:hypothetical protein